MTTDTRPRPSTRCYIDGCSWWSPLLDAAGLKAWTTHERLAHRAEADLITLGHVDWHAQAMQAIRALAVKGDPFVISEVIRYGVPDAPHPRTDWARVQGEAEALGWIEQTGRLGRSIRPTTKGSPVAEWVGTYAAKRAAA